MALTAVVTRDPEVEDRARAALDPDRHDVLTTRTLSFARRQLRERPVSALVVDSRELPGSPRRAAAVLQGVWRQFPSVPVGVLASAREPLLLHELGAVGLRHLGLREEGGARAFRRLLLDLLGEVAAARVVRHLSPVLRRTHVDIVRAALDLTHRCPGAEDFAAEFGVTRPHLSRVLREAGLPSPGQLLGWARMLHAGHWLPDPGRSGESVARQLEFANGSTFRRSLRTYVGLTPTELAASGGLERVLNALVQDTGLAAASPVQRVA